MELSSSASTAAPCAAQVRVSSGIGTLVGVLGLIVVVFAGSVVLREPWRGHLAKGDQWVTAQALRFTRAWYRDGVWSLRGRLVQSPPTAEFQGWNQIRKFGLPGYVLLAYAILAPQELEPTLERLMRINLGIHLLLALVLAVVAWAVARATWPDRPNWVALVAAHCGVFVVLFPPIFYWGQNLCINDFLVLPLFTFTVAARWLRSSVDSRWGRMALDVGVAICVFVGTFTEFLFWVLVPYLLIVRRRRERAGLPHTTDRARLTVKLPFAIAMTLLLFVIVYQGNLLYMVGRGGAWAGGGGLLMAVIGRPLAFVAFHAGHFAAAFNLLGLLALGLAAFRLRPRGREVAGLPPVARGILVDLLVPCLIFTFAMAGHSYAHTFAAMKYVPFVALSWTFLTPLVVSGMRPGRRRTTLAWVYGILAAVAVFPWSNAYSDFFPAPELRWEQEGTFLRERTLPTDAVFSPSTEIPVLPPQRISLAERYVRHVYGPLDVHIGPTDPPPRELGFLWTPPIPINGMMALYGPPELYSAFGAYQSPVITEGDLSLVRFPVGQLVVSLANRPDAVVRRRLLDVLSGGLRPDAAALHPHTRPFRPLLAPLAMHLIQGLGRDLVYDRLYWEDERHFHWKADDRHFHPKPTDREFVVLGDDHYESMWAGVWMRLPVPPDDAAVGWGRLVFGLFDRAATGAPGAGEFTWRGYDVVLMPVEAVPARLRAAAPEVASWEAYLLYKDAKPVAAALGPARGAAGSDSLNWVCILFDPLVVDIGVPGDIVEPWRVRGHAAEMDGVGTPNG